MKAEIYNALATLNCSFDVALESLKVLQEEGVIKAEYVQRQKEVLEEIRAGINCVIASTLLKAVNTF